MSLLFWAWSLTCGSPHSHNVKFSLHFPSVSSGRSVSFSIMIPPHIKVVLVRTRMVVQCFLKPLRAGPRFCRNACQPPGLARLSGSTTLGEASTSVCQSIFSQSMPRGHNLSSVSLPLLTLRSSSLIDMCFPTDSKRHNVDDPNRGRYSPGLTSSGKQI